MNDNNKNLTMEIQAEVFQMLIKHLCSEYRSYESS